MGNGLHVVVKDVRSGIEDSFDGVEIAAKIGRQDLDASIGQSLADLPDSFSEVV